MSDVFRCDNLPSDEFSNSNQIDEIKSDIEYIFSKINWQHSFLDAQAIQYKNMIYHKFSIT